MKVFITGASSGIGEALAEQYAQQGATLGLVARRLTRLGEVAQRLQTLGAGQIAIYPVDVIDHAALARAARHFIQTHGVPDVVIGSAGISVGTLTEFAEDLDVFTRIIQTNLIALAATFQPFVDPMRTRCRNETAFKPRLVGIASVAGVRGLPGAGAYSASKAAVIRYCESLRVELRGSGVRVVTLMPGFVATPMTEKNPYNMPFMLAADEFARRAVKVIDRGHARRIIPWQMAGVAALLRLLPNGLYDWAFANAKRKPRQENIR